MLLAHLHRQEANAKLAENPEFWTSTGNKQMSSQDSLHKSKPAICHLMCNSTPLLHNHENTDCRNVLYSGSLWRSASSQSDGWREEHYVGDYPGKQVKLHSYQWLQNLQQLN